MACTAVTVLALGFVSSGVSEAERYAFMKRFDLYTQRGGG